MNTNVVDYDQAERDRDVCRCKESSDLSILKDVQKAYEERMELIERTGGVNKLQRQMEVLRRWVGDLVGQNTLLARAVEELEAEATTKLLLERRRRAETVMELRAEMAVLRRRLVRKESDLRGLVEVLRRLREFDYCTLDGIHFFEEMTGNLSSLYEETIISKRVAQSVYCIHQKDNKKESCDKVNEMKIMNDSLHKENVAKDREIRRLNKDVLQYEQTILNMRKELAACKCHTPVVPTKDAGVMADCCCNNEYSGVEPEKDYSAMLREESVKYQERINKMESSLKSSSESIRSLRRVNVALSEEAHALRRVCAALDEQCRAADLRARFKDDIIKEMRRQLIHAKTELKKVTQSSSKSQKDYVSGDHDYERSSNRSNEAHSVACVRQPRARKRDVPPADTPLHPESDSDSCSPRLHASDGDILSMKALEIK